MIIIEEPFVPGNFYESICDPGKSVLFFDIETTGFSREYSQIYLIGAAFRDNGTWILMQWFAENPEQEPDVIKAFLEKARSYQVLIHFNGKAFDLPFTRARADLFGIPFELNYEESIDLMTVIKPYKKVCGMDNIKQKSVEKLLGIDTREDTMNGGELIPVYYHYVKHKDQNSLHLLLLHNADDVRGMTDLTQAMILPDFFHSEFCFEKSEELPTGVVLHYTAGIRMPMLVNQDYGPFSISAGGSSLTLFIPFYEGELRHYFKDYKNYYYLPGEDMVVHKSVAAFVDKDRKKKATRQNCYVKKAGRFLPQPAELITPVFENIPKEKQYYFEYTQMMDELLCSAYLQEILKHI